MATQREIINDFLTALALSEPDLATGVGSVMRKILDPVAEAIAERDADSYLHQYAYDIDAKSGADLDEMVRLFGFNRLPAQRASGEITFSRATPSATNVVIPIGTQVTTSQGVVAQTIVAAVLPVGDLSIAVPAQALEGGTKGNVPASGFSEIRTLLDGITNPPTNITSFTGGTDAESDAHLRKRFRETVFRSLAGTDAMFVGVGLNDRDVTQANVVGATKRWFERIEVVGGTATSTVQDAAYIVPESSVLGGNIQGGSIKKVNAHYTFDDLSNPPEVNEVGTGLPDGFYDLEFLYVPKASRNDLANGISNRVDLYVKGPRVASASETAIHQTARTFNNTVGSPYLRTNFQRDTEVNPTNGNFFIPLALVPIVELPDTITINSVTYSEGVHYWLVYDVTNKGGAPRSLAGIELRSSANGSPLADPPNLAAFPITYSYNAVPRSIEGAIGGTWRIVNQDVWVHQARLLRLRLNFAVVIERGYTISFVQDALEAALSEHIDSIGFNNVLQASDLLQIAHGVPGVDAIRFLTDEDDGTHYAIQRVTEAGTVAQTYATSGASPLRALDVYGGDDETPVLQTVYLDQRAQNTWGSV